MNKNQPFIPHLRLSLLVFLLLALFTHQTHASLIGQSITASFIETGFPDEVDAFTVSATANEIEFKDGSNIGDVIMLDGEFINFSDSQLVLSIRGDGPAHTQSGFQTTGFTQGASYMFTGFDIGIEDLSLSFDNIIGVSLGNEVTFGADFIRIDISTLGVGQITGAPDLGSITLDVTLIPVPAALPLFLFGLTGLGAIVYKRRTIK